MARDREFEAISFQRRVRRELAFPAWSQFSENAARAASTDEVIPVARKLWLPSLVAMPAAAAPSGKLSRRLPAATGIVFRETTADYENSWHRAPRRQYVISRAGEISITASDGETRHIGVQPARRSRVALKDQPIRRQRWITE
jgi:alkylated DNA nucleotide flippase Atl1